MLGRFGGYEITGAIGYGGMGIVLKGLDASLNRYVAIKVLSPHLAASGPARRRFAREAQAAAAVVHENVVAIHGVAESGGLPFFVMPYIRGNSLQKRLDEHGALATAEVLRIGMQTALGLAAAHAQGLVHRDIKPANVLLADGVERVQITDFGLARAVDDASLTRTGMIAGTPQYMSPEQARGELVDARSDLFSLGSLMYAMCTGRPPFRAETSLGVLQRISDSKPRPIQEIKPEIPAWLARIISRLHEADPADRFQSAGELAVLLERCLAHVQQPNLVELPDECHLDPPRELSRATQKTTRWSAIRNTAPSIRWTIVSCAVLAIVFASALIVNKLGSDNPDQHEQSSESTIDNDQRPLVSSSSADQSSAITWDDGVTEQVQASRQRVLVLRHNSEQLWEVAPTSTLPKPTSPMTEQVFEETTE
jgi:serine/threonine protein kinase